MNARKIFGKLLKKLNPTPPIGGLEMGDGILRYLLLNETGAPLKEVTLRLPAGIIVDGRVKNRPQLVAVLKELQKQIGRHSPIDVVVSISATNVYLQTFNLPAMAAGKLNEAAQLNLRMISPVNISSSYYDWEIINKNELGSGRPINLLGGFVAKEVVDELSVSLDEAGFNVVAIESTSLSLARVIGKWLNDSTKLYIVLNLSGDGLDFFIIKSDKLYFSYFISWATLQRNGGVINLVDVKDVIGRELRRLMGFYTSNWGGIIEDIALVGMADNKEIFEHIKKNLPLNIRQAKTNSAVGAALRGLVLRSDDHFISLARIDTEERFFQSRALTVVRFWRNMVVTVLATTLLIYGVLDLASVRLATNISRDLAAAPKIVGIEDVDVKQLEAEANEFNQLVNKAVVAEKRSVAWSSVFDDLYDLTRRRGIITKQIQLQQEDSLIIINGQAGSERDILNFKDDLGEDSNFTEIFLPLTAIRVGVNGEADFKISFKLKE